MPPACSVRMAEERTELTGEKARQGEIVLRRRWQRVVFVAGLVGIVVVALAWRLA